MDPIQFNWPPSFSYVDALKSQYRQFSISKKHFAVANLVINAITILMDPKNTLLMFYQEPKAPRMPPKSIIHGPF